jgi:hypothetical protein
MTYRHRVFISYHHQNDQSYRNIFQLKFGNRFGVIVSGAVGPNDIDPTLPHGTIRRKIRDEYLRDTSVTVVLVGVQTWQRRHVDWEISSSLRNTKLKPRSGLLGLLLPSREDHRTGGYVAGTVPPRLHDNVERGYAVVADWTEDHRKMQDLVHQAWLNKKRVEPTNARPLFRYNKSAAAWAGTRGADRFGEEE